MKGDSLHQGVGGFIADAYFLSAGKMHRSGGHRHDLVDVDHSITKSKEISFHFSFLLLSKSVCGIFLDHWPATAVD